MKEAFSKQGLCMLRFLLLFNKFSSLSIPVLYATFKRKRFYFVHRFCAFISRCCTFIELLLSAANFPTMQCFYLKFCFLLLSSALLNMKAVTNVIVIVQQFLLQFYTVSKRVTHSVFLLFFVQSFLRDDAFNFVSCKFTSFEYKFCYYHILNIYLTFVGEINFHTLIP